MDADSTSKSHQRRFNELDVDEGNLTQQQAQEETKQLFSKDYVTEVFYGYHGDEQEIKGSKLGCARGSVTNHK